MRPLIRASIRRLRFALCALTLVAASVAIAATPRTFVSAGGADNAVCALATPCRTFNAALAATSGGGEIVVLDSGGYAPMAIAQSVSIAVPRGVYASVGVASGNGVVIDSGTGSVSITGLAVLNQGSSGSGIVVKSAASVVIDGVTIAGFASDGARGIDAAAISAPPASVSQIPFHGKAATPTRITISRSVLRDNATAIATRGPATASCDVVVTDTVITGGTDAISVGDDASLSLENSSLSGQAGAGVAVAAATGGHLARAAISRTRIAHARGAALRAGAGAGRAEVVVSGSQFQFSATGLDAGANAVVRLTDTTIADNATGIAVNGGVVESAGNNAIRGNGADGPDPVPFATK